MAMATPIILRAWWVMHQLLSFPSKIHKICRKSEVQSARKKTTSLAILLEMTNVEVGHVLGINCVVALVKSCWNGETEMQCWR